MTPVNKGEAWAKCLNFTTSAWDQTSDILWGDLSFDFP